jgi:4-hydroxy-4-methyl-2-oxoglutarate aldolase
MRTPGTCQALVAVVSWVRSVQAGAVTRNRKKKSAREESRLSSEDLDALRSFDTCTVSNAIEAFGVRLRNTGFADDSIRCMFPDIKPVVGYAATARLRCGDPPMVGGIYHERKDWWTNILQVPPPRMVVLEDTDAPPEDGGFLDSIHAAILRALGCVAYVTNGTVRNLPYVHDLGVQLFAGGVSVSHAYAHMFDLSAVVNVGGLEVKQGDLLHGDRHGILKIPKEVAARIPAVAAQMEKSTQKILDFCRSGNFSIDQLCVMLRELD